MSSLQINQFPFSIKQNSSPSPKKTKNHNGKLYGKGISQVKFHPTKSDLLAHTQENNLFLSSINKQTQEMCITSSLSDHFYSINCLSYNETGSLVATGGNDGLINIYDISSGPIRLFRNIALHENESAVTCIDFNYTSHLMICGIYDKQIHVFDVRMNKPAFKIIAHSEPITSLSFSDDGLNFISTSYDGFLRVWDIYKGNCLKTIFVEKSPAFTKAKVLPNGRHALVQSLNNNIQLIDLETEEEIMKYQGHKNTNYIIDFDIIFSSLNKSQPKDMSSIKYNPKSVLYYNSDHIYLASGSEDGCLYIWDFNDGSVPLYKECKLDNSNQASCLFSISVNSDSSLICTASEIDGQIIRNNSKYLLVDVEYDTFISMYSLEN